MTTRPPSAQSPLVDMTTGKVMPSWMRFFQDISGGMAAAINPLTLSVSPLVYTASVAGTLAVVGGAISSVKLNRARDTINLLSAPALIPMGQGDTVTIAYTAAPIVNFIPS